jgi:putative methionine-R-sulfoxide reductase with GAF domain
MKKYISFFTYLLLFLATSLSLWAIFEINSIPEKILRSIPNYLIVNQNQLSAYSYLPIWILGLSTIVFLVVSIILQIQATRSSKTELVYVPKYMSQQTQQSFENSNLFDQLPENETELLMLAAQKTEAVCGFLFEKQGQVFVNTENYASARKSQIFELGQGLIGQVGKTAKKLLVTHVPQGEAFAHSGLGSSSVSSLLILPLIKNGEVYKILELGYFKSPSADIIDSLENLILRFTQK